MTYRSDNARQSAERFLAMSQPAHRRKYTCRSCGGSGHNTATCDKRVEPRAPRPGSKSRQAALWLRETGATLLDAANRHGVTRQAVQQAYARMTRGRDTPVRSRRKDLAARAVQMATDGMTVDEVADAMDMPVGTVRRDCGRAGVVPVSAIDVRRRSYVAAVQAVASGKCRVDIAADLGVSLGTLDRYLKEAGVSASRSQTGRMDGRSARAADLVESGWKLAAAARHERVAPSSVGLVLKRRRTA